MFPVGEDRPPARRAEMATCGQMALLPGAAMLILLTPGKADFRHAMINLQPETEQQSTVGNAPMVQLAPSSFTGHKIGDFIPGANVSHRQGFGFIRLIGTTAASG